MITTEKVLAELGAENKEVLTVYNKVDLVADENVKLKANLLSPKKAFISAQTGEGTKELLSAVRKLLQKSGAKHCLPYSP